MKKPVAVLRWHVSRTGLRSGTADGSRDLVRVTVDPGSEGCLRDWSLLWDDIELFTMDRFSWWDQPGGGARFTIDPDLLRESLAERGLLLERGEGFDPRRERFLPEDAVLLQFFFDAHEFASTWRRAATEGFDPGRLAGTGSARWLDFTRQARRGSSTVYETLLKGSEWKGAGDDS
jgi:hypothetical protein